MTRREQQELIDKGLLLPLMEEFYTIQGEGYHKGTASYFIRVGGCDVGCHWCDVKQSWDPDKHPLTEVDDIASKAARYSDTIIITGGEPLLYNMNPLTELLKEKGLKTHIETCGAYPVSGVWDWICLSPKRAKRPVEEAYAKANELKVIIHNKGDFKFAESQAKKITNDNCILYLQPEWSTREKMMPLIVDYVMANPKWKVSLQTHKYLNIP